MTTEKEKEDTTVQPPADGGVGADDVGPALLPHGSVVDPHGLVRCVEGAEEPHACLATLPMPHSGTNYDATTAARGSGLRDLGH
jgi:hypothetical protein